MSIYDSSRTNIGNTRTQRATQILTRIIIEEMSKKGFKATVKSQVPATFTEPRPVCYHLDLGVLFRSRTEYDFYHFFGVEIDDSSHATANHERKDRTRDEAFFINKGIVTLRIPIDKIFEERKDEASFFDKWIWQELLKAYIVIPGDSVKTELRSEINRNFAITLKENSATKCSKCDHLAHQHDLTGCSFRLTNKSKLKCNCHNAYFRSDE